jgi:uncharacterized protein (TIGR00369 family)
MDDADTLTVELRDRMAQSAFYGWADIELVHAEPGRVDVALQAGPQHVNIQGLVHGGMLATLADTAMGLAMRTVLEPGRRHVTVQLGVEYLSAGTQGRIVATGRTLKVGRQLGFAEADVRDDGGTLLARAHATISVTKPSS